MAGLDGSVHTTCRRLRKFSGTTILSLHEQLAASLLIRGWYILTAVPAKEAEEVLDQKTEVSVPSYPEERLLPTLCNQCSSYSTV